MQSDTGTSVSSSLPKSITHSDPPQAESFTLSKDDIDALREYVDEFPEADADRRSTIIANAMADIVEIRRDGQEFNKIDASKKIRKWFYNHYARPERQYIKFIRRWSARNTYFHMCRDEVMMEAEEMSGSPPGSQAFLGSLQDATTKLWKRLTPGVQQIYVRLAKKWSDEPPPPNIQARLASSVSGKIVRDFQRQLFKACGVRCVVLAAHEDEAGKIVTSLLEIEKPNDAEQPFLSFCPDWKDAPVFREWQKYAKKIYKSADIETVPNTRSKPKRAPSPIRLNSDGCPKLPTLTEKDEETCKTKAVQITLRKYMKAHIKYVSGRKTVKIPWGKISDDPSSWVEAECVPDGFQWADPSKIRIADVFKLFEHWRERKRQHLTPLIWVATCPLLRNASPTFDDRQQYHSDDPDSSSSDMAGPEPSSSDPQLNSENSRPISDELDNDSDSGSPDNVTTTSSNPRPRLDTSRPISDMSDNVRPKLTSSNRRPRSDKSRPISEESDNNSDSSDDVRPEPTSFNPHPRSDTFRLSYKQPDDDFVSGGHSPHSHQEGEWGGFEYNENDSLPLHMEDPFQEDLGFQPLNETESEIYDGHMGDPFQEDLGFQPLNEAEIEIHDGHANRDGQSAFNLADRLRMYYEREGSTESPRANDTEHVSELPPESIGRPKRKITLTYIAKHVDSARGTERLTNNFLLR